MKPFVLIVEDEPSIVDNIQYALKTDGFDVANSGTSKDALKFISTKTPDLMILDVGLPDQSGFSFAKQIRENYNFPIIFVTARADEVDRVLGLELGADDYLVKPFSPRELVARVKAVLRRTQPNENNSKSSSTIINKGPYQIDQDRYIINYHSQQLQLSRYEYRILVLFVHNPGKVFTREQLMDRVWDVPEMSLLRTVDTHIKTLRQKLKLVDDSSESIVTHRGIGYSLKDY